MLKNIDQTLLNNLYKREPEAKLVVDTMLTNHKHILAALNHEIRNPLTLLYGNMQLLQNKYPLLKADPLWTSALEDFHYTHELLEQLSAYNNSKVLSLKPTNGSEFFSSIALSFSSSITDTDINFIFHIPELHEMTIDQTKVKQVLINLLKNAREAISKGGNIYLCLNSTSDNLEIKVQDTGCGITETILENIFTPFVTNKDGGTGLGLAICRDIVDAHKGTITVNSTVGQGTCFYINLPIG